MAALCQLNDLLGNAARASIPVEELEEIARENAELALQVILTPAQHLGRVDCASSAERRRLQLAGWLVSFGTLCVGASLVRPVSKTLLSIIIEAGADL